MRTDIRRYFAATIVAAVAVAVVQALLLFIIILAYRQAVNEGIGRVFLVVENLVVVEEIEAKHDWPAIERRLRAHLRGVADDDEMAIYDEAGTLLARSSGVSRDVPAQLDAQMRARIGADVAVLRNSVLGDMVVATRRDVGGQILYLLRANRTVRNSTPGLPLVGLLALLVPMLLLGVTGAYGILRLTGRQLVKVDRVLRMMAGGDLSARLSLPVDEETAGVVLSFNRMAEKVEATVEKLRQSDESRRQLLADVTHELNTPLTSVLGYLETLCMEDLPLPAERRHELTQIAYEEAVNLRALIEDLTTLSRLDAEGLRLEREPLDLAKVAEKVVRRLGQIAEKRNVPLHLELEPGVEVAGDPQRLDQVVRNLVENAIRHTTAPGDVVVAVRRDGFSAVIEVRDRGTGIAPEDLARLGTRFLRLDKSRARHTGGRGLGLAITVGLVEMHGGRVRFESVVGSGTKVTVTIPLLVPAGDAAGGLDAEASGGMATARLAGDTPALRPRARTAGDSRTTPDPARKKR